MLTKIAIVGINHKKAPVNIRERFSLSATEQQLLLSELKNSPEVIEAFVLSTCNRVEVYAHLLNEDTDPYFLLEVICQVKKIPYSTQLREYFYTYIKEEAVRHLLKVTSGLDSLVVGEKQILGQVKEAVELAQSKALFQQTFNILSNIAIRAGKKAQNETEISSGGSSVGWAAVTMAEKICNGLENKSILIIGAGKMSHLAIQQLRNKSIKKLYIMNRTHENAVTLAEHFNATIVSLYDLKDILTQVDLCITSVAAPHHIIEKELIEKVVAARPGRRLALIDIAVPRNVAPDVAEVENVALCSVDDLEGVIAETMNKRQAAVTAVEMIVNTKLSEFYDKIQKIQDFKKIINNSN